LAAVVVILGVILLTRGKSTKGNAASFAARRGNLPISVLEGGSVEALESQEIRSEIKGYQGTKILSIVEEGYLVTEDDVKNGKVLVELDSSDLKQRITTQEIQFQSTLASLIEAQQSYDIQLNQNESDIKAAEQKARFARMDFEKFMGDKTAQEVIAKLGLYEKPITNELDLEEMVADITAKAAGTAENAMISINQPFMGSNQIAMLTQMRSGGPSGAAEAAMARLMTDARAADPGAAPDIRRMQMPPGADTAFRPGRGSRPTNAPSGRGRRNPDGSPDRPGAEFRPRPPGGSPSQTPAAMPSDNGPADPAIGPGHLPFGPGTNLALAPAGPGLGPMAMNVPPNLGNIVPPTELRPGLPPKRADNTNTAKARLSYTSINAPVVDFTKYAKAELLADGSAKQQLRKLEDDLKLSQQELVQSQIHLDGTMRLFTNEFVTSSELTNEILTVNRKDLSVKTARTAHDLYLKYEFSKSAEEALSKYDEALRGLERARKEAISKLAQARARLKAAESRYRIESEQRQELYDQLSKCSIRAKRTGLVVYGGGDERRFFMGEEQIREGATVRERQAIITIPDMTKMAVKLRIHESHIKKVQKGLKARIQVDSFPDESLTGEVIKVGVLPDSQSRWMSPDLKVYVTSVAIDGVYEWLKPGMSAKVDIRVKELTNVVYVPIQAVVPINGKQVCYLANGHTPEEREVEVGDFNDEFIEIKKGLKEGERVLLRAPEGTGKEAAQPEEKTEEESANGGAVNSRPPVPSPEPARGGPRPGRQRPG
jgi:multidrug efflux pump subunit AcrA (membrane-fusion protein)